MTNIVYDAGVLIAADNGVRRVWAEHAVRLELGILPLVPSAVLAQASRSPRQVQLRRLVAGCEVVPLLEADAHRVGELLARAKTSDVMDASVVELAARRAADVVTSDPKDIRRLVAAHPGARAIRVVAV